MDPLSSNSLSAARAATQSYALRGQRRDDEAVDPSPEAASALAEAGTQSRFTMSILKKTLAMDAAEGEDLAKLMGQGSHLDVYA